MAAQVPKLLAITQIRSSIGRPHREKVERTLKALGVGRVGQTQIHWNAPTINSMATSVLNLVRATPVVFRPDRAPSSPNAITFPTGKKAFVNASFEVEGVTEEEFLAGMSELIKLAKIDLSMDEEN